MHDEEEVEEEDETKAEDQDEDDGKEPWTVGQGEMVTTSADDVDTMVDNERISLPEHGQEMRAHTPWPQPLATALRPQTLEPPPQPRTLETHCLTGVEGLGLWSPRKPPRQSQVCKKRSQP